MRNILSGEPKGGRFPGLERNRTPALVNVYPDVSDAYTKARVIDGLLLAMRISDPDCGLVVTLNQGDAMPIPEVGIEFLPYQRLGS